jgi:hypothetical protein
MNRLLERITELDIFPEDAAFTITNHDLLAAIADEVDLETVTYQELREIFFIVKKSLSSIDWQATAADAVRRLPFGLNQTGIAWQGNYPCTGCPDAMLYDNNCYHQGECKSWEIYESRF